MEIQQNSIKRASLINMVAKYSVVFIQLFYTAIISRILSPEEFGIVAVVTVFSTFFALFSDLGIATGIIQNKELTDYDNRKIFGFSFWLGLILMILFCFFAFAISKFYDDKVYIPVCFILSISIFFNCINSVPNGLLLKQKKFIFIGIRLIIVSIISAIVTIILAKKGYSYYSIVFYSVSSAVLTFFWNFFLSKLKFGISVDFKSLNKIFNYSFFQFLFNFINYFSRNIDNLLIGKFMGNAQLGFYNKSYSLMKLPTSNLTHVITPVLQPILSDYQSDINFIYKQYIKIIKILSIFGVYISLFCFFESRELIFFLFGSQWVASVSPFHILAISIWPQMMSGSAGSIYQSIGNTKLLFKSGLLGSIIIVSLIILGLLINKDLTFIASMISFAYCLNFFQTFYFLIKKGLGKKMLNFLSIFIVDVIIYIMMFYCFTLLNKFILNDILIINLIIKGLISGVIYLLLLKIFKQDKFIKILISR